MTSWLSDEETRSAALAAGFQLAGAAAAIEALRPIEQYLPMSLIPGAAGSVSESGDLSRLAECNAFFWHRLDHGALWLLDYEYQTTEDYRDDSGYRQSRTHTHTGTVAALLDPRIAGEVDIRKDWKSGVGGAILNAFLWVPPFTIVKAFQYGWAPKDLKVGQDAFDDRFVVESSSQEAAQAAVGPALGQCLLQIEFKERLRIRPGVALIRLSSSREKGRAGFATEMQRLHAIVTAILSGVESQPYR